MTRNSTRKRNGQQSKRIQRSEQSLPICSGNHWNKSYTIYCTAEEQTELLNINFTFVSRAVTGHLNTKSRKHAISADEEITTIEVF